MLHSKDLCIGCGYCFYACPFGAPQYPKVGNFGSRGKIFMVHFRNIRGGFLNFDEVYPDEGDVDMFAAVNAYLDSGANAMLCPDHVPHSEVDPHGDKQFSYCLGHTKALLQVAHSLRSR